jgi:tellurite resistance protein
MALTRTARDERGSHQHAFRRVRVPPNFFAMAFGVAGLAGAWFALAGPGALSRPASMIGYALGGYAVLMVLAQLRLSLVYTRLSFAPGFWAFTFSYSAVVADALAWLALKRPPGETGYAIAAVTPLTGFIGWIAVRTALLAVRGRLFPHPDPA